MQEKLGGDGNLQIERGQRNEEAKKEKNTRDKDKKANTIYNFINQIQSIKKMKM